MINTAKPLKRIIEKVKDHHVKERLQLELCKKYGGAWIADHMPFSNEIHFSMYESPSKVPDSYITSSDLYPNKIAWKGKLQGFSEKARIREQNRGIGGDR